MQDASDILALSIQLTMDVSQSDDILIVESIEELLFPLTEVLQGLPGNLMLGYVKASVPAHAGHACCNFLLGVLQMLACLAAYICGSALMHADLALPQCLHCFCDDVLVLAASLLQQCC